MLKGDLATTPFGAVIGDLAAPESVGCLHVEGPDGDEALVYFKAGAIYSAYLPGRRPQLGARLISSGALAPEALEEALEAQATELQGWRLGELLVHLGFVEAEVVQAFSIEQVRDACFELSRWTAGKWKFRKNEKTREDIAAPVEIAGILDEILRREQEWAILVEVIGGTESVPTLGAGGLSSGEMALNQDEWALLCKVDGERNLHQLARDCGFTDFEAGQIVSSLVMTGLLEIEGAAEAAASDEDDESPPTLTPRSAAARLMAAFSGTGDDIETDVSDDVDFAAADDAELAMPSYLNSLVLPLTADEAALVDEESVGSELTRLLGSRDEADVVTEVDFSEFADAAGDSIEPEPAAYTSYALPPIDPDAFGDSVPSGDPDADLPRYSVGFGQRTKFDESLSAVSDALSALLGAQPAAVDALSMFNGDFAPTDESDEEERARIIREAAAAEMATAHAEMEEQRRRFDDARKRAEEEAEQEAAAEAARIAAAQEAARILAEQEGLQLQAEAAAAKAAAEARAESEAREAADAEQERERAAEEAARVEAELAAAQAAEDEAARVAAEEAERAADEQSRAAADELARIEAEERARADEAVRVAEDAARAAAEDAARAAEDEDADRRRAEEAAAQERADDAARAQEAAAARLAEEEAQRAEDAARAAADAQLAAAMIELEEPAPSPPPPPPAAPAPAPVHAPVMTDTASLMRELSSLGFDDDPAPAQAPSRPSAPVGAGARPSAAQGDKGKKRKGLFGRG